MGNMRNIIIADESALFFFLHSDDSNLLLKASFADPLLECAAKADDFRNFNPSHPLYGGQPVHVLVSKHDERRRSKHVICRYCPNDLPDNSFFKIRDGLFITSPELVFARMGNIVSETCLAEIGTNLCGRYYVNHKTSKIEDRRSFLTTPKQLQQFAQKASDLRGARKAQKALRWVMPNSGSPMETKMALLFCSPLWRGGFALPFAHMNYDVSAGRLANLAEQSKFCIDLAESTNHTGFEYDGEESHLDPSKDKRRRNALQGMGWKVFVIDKEVLFNPDATIRAALQVAKHFGIRLRFPKTWSESYMQMRKELGLS